MLTSGGFCVAAVIVAKKEIPQIRTVQTAALIIILPG